MEDDGLSFLASHQSTELYGHNLAVLWVLLAYLGIQQIESNLLEPLVMEEAVSLHPAVVVTAVTVVGAAFGVSWAPYSRSRQPWRPAILVEELWFGRLEDENILTEPKREQD